MELLWQIQDSDIQRVLELYKAEMDKKFVVNRIQRNIEKLVSDFSKEIFWEAMVSCLLTTQQRSGPYSEVTRFICTQPLPLTYAKCRDSGDIKKLVEDTITAFGGIRRAPTLGKEIDFNFR